jgi:trans-aconitate methyltransferase
MDKTKNYTWDAKDYSKNSQNQFQWAKELIPKLKLQGNETLLDIGCGNGKITEEIARCLPTGKVVGVDSSTQMINMAKNSFPLQEYPNLSFQVMDARNLTFQSEFDVIFSNAALHWIVDQPSLLQCVYKSLKPSGRLLFQMAGEDNAKDIISILNELINEQLWKQFFEGFTFPYGFYGPKKYSTWLNEAKLKPQRVELFPKDMKLIGAEGLAGWIRTTWLPYTEHLPSDQRSQFIGEISKRYLKNHPADGEGVVHLGMMRLEVEATKP